MNVLKHHSYANVHAPRLGFGRSCQRQSGVKATRSTWLRVLLALCCLSITVRASAEGPGASSTHKSSKGKSAKANKAKDAAPTLPSAVLLATSGNDASSSALDSIIQAELEEMHVVNVIARPGMDLSAVLLALDCVSETAQCLRAVTAQNGSDVLIAPNVARTPGEVVLSVLRFDNEGGQMKRVLRRQTGSTLSSATLDGVPNMLRELFGLPPKEPEQPVAAALPPPETTPSYDSIGSTEPALATTSTKESSGSGVPVGPIILGAGGVVLVAVASGFGASVLSMNSEYDKAIAPDRRTLGSIDRAVDLESKGSTNATISTVLFSVGGAVLGAAAIWLAVQLMEKPSHADKKPFTEDTSSGLSVAPMLSPNQVGVMFTKHGVGL